MILIFKKSSTKRTTLKPSRVVKLTSYKVRNNAWLESETDSYVHLSDTLYQHTKEYMKVSEEN